MQEDAWRTGVQRARSGALVVWRNETAEIVTRTIRRPQTVTRAPMRGSPCRDCNPGEIVSMFAKKPLPEDRAELKRMGMKEE
jgi:hypothetical protein